MQEPLTIEPFTLGKPFGLVAQTAERPSGPETRPFGLRFAVEPPASATADIGPERFSYDHERQLALVSDGDVAVPVVKHTSNQTKTSTSSHDRNPPDDDTDVGGD